MTQLLKKIFELIRPVLDLSLSVAIVPAAFMMIAFRCVGAHRLPRTSRKLKNIGVFPVRDHYYDPQFNEKHLLQPLSEDRDLPGVDLNIDKQLDFLEGLTYTDELRQLNLSKPAVRNIDFSMENRSFRSGDAEFLYQLVRKLKPSRIIEIGSGNSTKIVRLAVERNKIECGMEASHICIEPFEQPWLTELHGITLIRERIENA